ncbi:hypothetical protein F210042A8_01000 [Blautia parvula]
MDIFLRSMRYITSEINNVNKNQFAVSPPSNVVTVRKVIFIDSIIPLFPATIFNPSTINL